MLRCLVLEMALKQGVGRLQVKSEGRRKSKSRTRNGGNISSIRHHHCKKEGHTRRFCPERQEKGNNLDRLSRSGK